MGTAFLGSYITAVNGTSVTLAGGSGYAFSTSTPVSYGNAITLDNVLNSSGTLTPIDPTITVTSGTHTIACRW